MSLGSKRKSKIDRWQLEIIALYLDAGYSIYDLVSLNLWPSNNNQQFDVENWLSDLNLDIVKYLLDFLPLNKALRCYLQIGLFKEEFKKNIIKTLLYPILQLVLAFAISLLAQRWVLPLIQSLLGDLEISAGGVGLFSKLISITNYTIIVLIILGIGSWLLLHYKEKSAIYLLLNTKIFILFKELTLYQFVNYYLILYQASDGIEIIINGLRKLPESHFINLYGDWLHFSLNDGKSLEAAFALLDEKLATIFKLAKDTGKIRYLLQSYIQELNLKFEKSIKKIGTNCQIFSYCYILLLVLLVYQMMLMPLAMIERM